MRRFYDPDDDDFNIHNEDAELNDEELAAAYAFIDESDLAHAMQIDLAEQELDQEMMNKAIKIAKQNWFWSFKSNKKKMSEIEFIYTELNRIRNQQLEEEEEE